MEATLSSKAWQLSADQEREVLDWISRECAERRVARTDQLRAFAERLIQRDGSNDTLAPDFVSALLGRHRHLATQLVSPPAPNAMSSTTKKLPPSRQPAGPARGLDRLNQMMQQERTRAMFGDSPPPPRQPAPYPEGEIIFQSNGRYIVRHGDTVTKYTTDPYGMGAKDQPNEALALRFIKENATIPVPEVFSSDWDRITMEHIEGQTLKKAWPSLTSDQRSNILDELRGYISQLRALTRPNDTRIGRVDGQGVVLPTIIPRSGGPFDTLAELHHWLVRPPRRLEKQSMYWHQITTQLGTEYPVVFTHGDIAARNIMVRDGHIVAILDWEFAGWYPEYWDYVLALRGLDNVDWESLGSHVPSLFDKRYDLEYILMTFVLNLS